MKYYGSRKPPHIKGWENLFSWDTGPAGWFQWKDSYSSPPSGHQAVIQQSQLCSDSVCLTRSVSAEQPGCSQSRHRADLKPSTAEIVHFQNQILCPPKQVFAKSRSSAEDFSLFHLYLLCLTHIWGTEALSRLCVWEEICREDRTWKPLCSPDYFKWVFYLPSIANKFHWEAWADGQTEAASHISNTKNSYAASGS